MVVDITSLNYWLVKQKYSTSPEMNAWTKTALVAKLETATDLGSVALEA